MHDLAGILILLGLVVLAVPLLLIVVLIKLGNARARIEDLERDVQGLHARVAVVESRPAATPRADTAPAAAKTPEATPAAAPAAAPARFDAPPVVETVMDVPAPPSSSSSHVPAVPPPLPARAEPAPRTPAPVREAAPPPAWTPPAEPPRDVVGEALGRAVDAVRGWFTEGNVPVKIGMLVLLAGVAALLKYASDQGWVYVPMELRLAGVAAAAIGGLVFAWRQREERRAFSLSLQGGAIGVLMLVAFAAFKLYHLIPAGAAFGITIALVAGLCVLAVLQEALALAVFGILAGFLAPIWLSTGSGNHVALFSYYAVLNLGIFAIAWNRPWRLLNLIGFVFTFAIGTLWGVLDYRPEKFASTEPFLILFFVLYLLIPVLYANRRSTADGNAYRAVDGTLVIGTPLVVFALQAGLLHGAPFGDGRMPLALSALAMAATYALLAAGLRSRPRFATLIETWAVIAVGFATLAVPLALSARATASVFAIEGAILVWLGLRQDRRLPQLTGLLLQLGAAVAYVAGIGGLSAGFTPTAALASTTPIANAAYMSALLIAIGGFATAWIYRRTLDTGLVALFALWGLGWWTFAGGQEIVDHVPDRYAIDAMFAFLAGTGWLTAEARRRFDDFPVFGATAALALVLGVPFAMIQSADHDHPFAHGGALAWLFYGLAGWRALTCLRATGMPVRLLAHGGWFWSWIVAIALGAFHLVYHDSYAGATYVPGMGDGWRIVALGLPVLLFAAVLRLRPALLAPPLARGFEDYRSVLLASAAAVLGFGWLLSLFFPGASAPLPWVTVLNPLELFQLAVLALLAHEVWGAGRQGGRVGVPLFALATFGWITFATLRGVHHWGHVAWSPSMLDDGVVQTALTVVWSVLGVLGWIFGSRRGERLLWGAGAVLMAVVLLKLLIVDRGNLGDIFGIVSFIAYGLLCAAVGYFAPAPPRRAATESPA